MSNYERFMSDYEQFWVLSFLSYWYLIILLLV